MAGTGWLIEQYIDNKLHYWCSGQAAKNLVPDQKCGGWTTSVHDAVWFVREQDANVVLFRLLDGCGRTAEHEWIAQDPQA